MIVTPLFVFLCITGHVDCWRSRLRPSSRPDSGSCVCTQIERVIARRKPSLKGRPVAVLPVGGCYRSDRSTKGHHQVEWSRIQVKNNQYLWVPTYSMTRGNCSMECPGVTMVTRDEWHARAPRHTDEMPVPVDFVFIHHTAMDACDSLSSCSAEMRVIQDYHMDNRSWDDIGYNFLVGGDGRVYVGRGWDRVGAHTYGYNNKSVAVSFMGDYMTTTPSEGMLEATKRVIQCGVEKGYISSNYSLHGHRDVRCTECPGDRLYEIISRWPHWHRTVTPSPVCNKQ